MQSNSIRRARQRAKQLASKDGITHQQALDAIARLDGHAHWADMIRVDAIRRDRHAPSESISNPAERPHAPFDDPFASSWLDMSLRAGTTSFDHHLSLSKCLVPIEESEGHGAALVALLAMDSSAKGRFGASMLLDVLRRNGIHAERRAAGREEVGSPSHDPDRWISLLDGIGDVAAGDGRAASMLVQLRRLDVREAGQALSTAFAALGADDRRPRIPFDVDGRSDLAAGVLAAGIAGAGVAADLTWEERDILLDAIRSESGLLFETVGSLSSNISAAAGALRMHVRPSTAGVTGLLELGCHPFGEASSTDLYSELIDHEAMASIERRDGGGILSTWLADAVRKAARDRQPFRFNPLAMNDGSPSDEGSWSRTQLRVANVLMAAVDVRPEASAMAASALHAIVRLCRVGIERGTIGDIVHTRESQVSMRMAWSILELADRDGPGQIILYSRISGCDAGVVSDLGHLSNPVVVDAVRRALRPFRHVVMARACAA